MTKPAQNNTGKNLNGNFGHLNVIKLYEKAASKVPILKYSWVIIATICILALIGYFKLQKTEVLLYAIAVLFISFLGFVFSYIIKSATNTYIKFLLNVLITCIIIVICAAIMGFGSYLFIGKPVIFNGVFKSEKNGIDTNNKADVLPYTTRLHSLLYKIEFNSSLCDVLTYELGNDSCQHVRYDKLKIASECSASEIRYYWRTLKKSKIKDEFFPYLRSRGLLDKMWDDGYVTYFFQNNKLTRVAIRFVPKTADFDDLFVKSLVEGTSITAKNFISKEVDGIHYVLGSSFQDGHIIELFISNNQGYSSCIHDWWHDLKEN